MPIVIKKRVAFDFLGDDYKDAYLTFQSIPVKDFDEIVEKINKAQQEGGSASVVLETLQHYFIEGKFPDLNKVEADDLGGLDKESILKCFAIFTGQDDLDPKAPAQEEGPSKTPSSTTQAQ